MQSVTDLSHCRDVPPSVTTTDPPRILSVEDNSDTRLLLEHLLDESYELTLTASVDEALDAVESTSFDLLLLDIHLNSGTEGTELLHTIRNREDIGEVSAIALTAYILPGDSQELLDEGFDAYVSKPFTSAELTEAIDQTLSGDVESAA